MYKRPYLNRQVQSSMMSEDVVLRRVQQTRDRRGRTSETTTDITTRCSTEPLSKTDSRVGMLAEEGVRLTDVRVFYTIEKVNVEDGDEFIWKSARYKSITTMDWGDYSETIADRIEGQ